MKTLLVFDSWLGGLRNIKRFSQELHEINVKVVVVHLSSWSNLNYSEYNDNNIETIDISNFNSLLIEDIFNKVKPDIGMLLSVDVFAHRRFIEECNNRSIPVIHLFHGVMSALGSSSKRLYAKRIDRIFTEIFRRSYKYVRYILPFYFSRSSHTKKAGPKFLYFIETGIKIARSSTKISFKEVEKAKTCLVFSHYDIDYAYHKYGYQDISVIGNPDISDFGCDTNYLRTECISKKIVYIDSVPYLRGVCSFDENFAFLIRLKNFLYKRGYKLQIKLHPENNNKSEIFKTNGFEIIPKDSFVDAIITADRVISEPSTLAGIPAFYGCPIMLPKFEIFEKQNYGPFLTEYNGSFICRNIEDLLIDTEFTYIDLEWEEKSGCRIDTVEKFSEKICIKVNDLIG